MTERDIVRACPECDKPGVTPRQGWAHVQIGDADYRCRFCGARFDEPVKRERQATTGLTGVAKILDEMDPEDLTDS